MTFAVRYLNDYVIEQYPENGRAQCMDEKPYDLLRSNGPGSTVREEPDRVILVEPDDTSLPRLRFKNIGGDTPLQPADATTESVLLAHGCNWQSYDDR